MESTWSTVSVVDAGTGVSVGTTAVRGTGTAELRTIPRRRPVVIRWRVWNRFMWM
jgi:hypothetical protein